MEKIIKIAVILGARPNFVKAAPFFHEAKKHPEFQLTMIHTGQHFDANMSKIFFEEMGMPRPDVSLAMKGEFHTEKIGNMFNSLKQVFAANKFDAAIVFGDVNTTLAGALAAVKNNCPLIHIESGLRSHDRRMPEELNRVTVDHLSDILFTTEPSANANLKKEGVSGERIKYVGNIMIETIELFKKNIMASKITEDLGLDAKKFTLSTIHRQENTDDRKNLETILKLLNDINKDIKVVFPLHPGTRKKIFDYRLENLLQNLKIVEPLGYFEFMKLTIDSAGVITDSGGIQEETTHLGIPCATLRDNTERPITIEQGSNRLFTIDLSNAGEIISHLQKRDFPNGHIPFWDDKVSERIFKVLTEELS